MSTSDAHRREDRSAEAVLAAARQAIDEVMARSSSGATGDSGAAGSPDGGAPLPGGLAGVWRGAEPAPVPAAPAASDAEDESAALAGGVSPDDPEYKRAKKRALNMLAARDHATEELRSKLLRKEHPEDVVDTLLDRLTASGLLDDEQFAAGFVRARRESRALSVRALRQELTKKGIPESVSEHALEDLDDEYDLAYEVALKKARSTANLPHDTRLRRTLGMLARRGFPQSVCMAAARRALEDA
ncbi:recombination regulator RecX [Brevibacterium sp. R8603A2]|uniref:regulatory protein RecX n=1 Tax=Brevibacterium sp. R8603A2 TaxID=2929779 RepID=UPI001FF9C883|nr:regulatory protein RecX [Brevibacterium sp. R8603A2]MCK1801952.1 recombination regulator RecX [Brevibacterium sp. R8603A2]